MIIKRLLFGVIAAGIFAAGAAVTVVALAFALYALVAPRLGPAGAASVVALVTALFLAIFGAVLLGVGRRKPPPPPPSPEKLLQRAMGFVRDKPFLVAAAAVGAGLLAVRNPTYLGSVLRAFLDGKPPKA